MADRNYKPGAMCIEKGTIKLYGQALVIDAAGAITDNSKGFSMVRTGIGTYDIDLEDSYNDLRNIHGVVFNGLVSTSGYNLVVSKNDVGNKVLGILWINAEGAPADVTDGATFYIEITLKNSTVAY